MKDVILTSLTLHDIRYPTYLENHGTDAMHTDPCYSLAYVILNTNQPICGYGFSFTIGRGNEVVLSCIKALEFLITNKSLCEIVENFGMFWHSIVNESQLRWLGPEKGVIHLATGAIVNAIWDLWSRLENKPLWKLIVDMTPEELVSMLDFSYVEDFISKTKALEILKKTENRKKQLENNLIATGYPAYVTSAGWLGYEDDVIKENCEKALNDGFQYFKMKIGVDLESDKNRLQLVRNIIGENRLLMTDANQKWSVHESIRWMKELAVYNPFWIEEPTSCDDILGHATISTALRPYGIKVATGEHCHNKVMFKQFLKSGGMDICQIDCCRLAGPNEVIMVMLMAAEAKVPVCPHAGGVGLCEVVQHYSFIDYILLTETMENRMTEFVDHLHDQFIDPVIVKNGRYQIPTAPGFSGQLVSKAIEDYSYPNGNVWKNILPK